MATGMGLKDVDPAGNDLAEAQEFSFDPQSWLQWLREGKCDRLGEDILRVLNYYNALLLFPPEKKHFDAIAFVTRLIVRIIADPSFAIPREQVPQFIERNIVLANMLRLTEYGNADNLLKMIVTHKDGWGKFFALYSHFCTLPFNLRELYRAEPYLTSLWVSCLLDTKWYCSPQTQALLERLISDEETLRHFIVEDPQRYPKSQRTSFAYFYATYVNEEKDAAFKRRINEDMRVRYAYPLPLSKPDFSHILVASAYMDGAHAVYRSVAPQLYALKKKYRLSLFHLGDRKNENWNRDLFDHYFWLQYDPEDTSYNPHRLQEILDHGFGFIYYPDIGLNRASIVCANVRLAPIQVTAYGHPVSTHGGLVDYYIGGQDVEGKDPQQYYSEKLVLIPGLGVEPARVAYMREGLKEKKNTGTVYIMCSWGLMKFNPHLLGLARRIMERSTRRIQFEFVGIHARSLQNLVTQHDLNAIFPGKASVTPVLQRPTYLRLFEACHLAIDAHPFGGYNRIVDALIVGTPIVAYEGTRAPSRLAAALLRQAGLEELVARSDDEYVEKALRLVEDDAYRKELTARIEAMDLDRLLFNTGKDRYYLDAFDAMAADYHARQAGETWDRTPIIIPERA